MANEMNLPVPESRVDQYLYQIAQNTAGGGGGGGGGSELPAVTADDNGDVLTVVNGAWDKAAPSGGGVMFVHFTSEDNEESWTADKTPAEIYSAVSSDVLVKGVMRFGDGGSGYSYTYLDPYVCQESNSIFSSIEMEKFENSDSRAGYGTGVKIGTDPVSGETVVDVWYNSVDMENDD